MPEINKRDLVKTATGSTFLLASGVASVALADDSLALEILSSPSNVRAGDDVNITARVVNTGDEEQTTELEYRIDSQTRRNRQITLSAGGSEDVTFEATVPDLPPGTYTQGVFFRDQPDARGKTRDIFVRGSVFSAENFQGPASATTGGNVTASVTIRNTGNEEGTRTVRYRIAGEEVSRKTVTVSGGGSVAVTLSGTVPSVSSGTQTQGVFFDDEGIPAASSNIVVNVPVAQFKVESIVPSRSEARTGDSVSVDATIRNTGDVTGERNFRYRIGDRTVADRTLTLSAGGRRTVTFEGSVPNLAAGTYRQGVFVGDTNEGLDAPFRVTSPDASFFVVDFSAPSRAEVDENVRATARVENTGDARGSTNFEYRIDGTRVSRREVTLDPGERRTITLEGRVPDRDAGTYTQGVFVRDTSRGRTSSIRIDTPPFAKFNVSDLRAPSEAEAGSDIAVRATVTNDGDRTENARLEYRIGGDRVARRTVEVPARRSTTVWFDVTVPSDLRRGTYRQGVFIDGTDRGSTTSLFVRDRPRFTVTGFNGPPSASAGDRISAEATVRNRGDSRTTRTVEYRVGNRRVAQTDVRLNSGESRTVTLQGRVPDVSTGTYTQGFFVNGESSTARLEVRRRPTPRADIRVTSFEGPSEANAGDRIDVEATVGNQGDARGSRSIEYRIGGRVVTSRQVTLEAEASRDVTFTVTVPNLTPDEYEHGVFLADTTEGRTRTLRIRHGEPRFTVSDLRAPASGRVGDEIEVEAVVTNTGDGTGETEVEYRFDGDTLETEEVELGVGEEEELQFDVTVPDRDAGTYPHGVFVSQTDRGQTTSFAVEEDDETEDEEALPGFGAVAGIAGVLGGTYLYRRFGSDTDTTPQLSSEKATPEQE